MVRIVGVFLLCWCLVSGEMFSSETVARRLKNFLENAAVSEQAFDKEFEIFLESGFRTVAFNETLRPLHLGREFALIETEDMPPELSFMSCAVCRLTAATYISQRRGGASADSLGNAAVTLCLELTSFPEHVCRPVVFQNLEAVIYIIDNVPSINAATFCSLVFEGDCGGADPSLDFTVSVAPGPAITQSKSISVPRNPNEIRILHLTDMHFDPRYLEGGWAVCPEIVCCRQDRGIAPNPVDRAGRWGDYRDCGTPWLVIEETIRRMREAHPDVSYIYYTGDSVDHGHWQRTAQGNRDIMSRIYAAFRTHFPGVPVYVTLGNHEAHPTNLFTPPSVTNATLRVQWLFDFSADQWAPWLPPSALATVRIAGYYTVLLQPGLRLISLSNTDCSNNNFWVLHSRGHIQAQLQWFHNTLLAAEQAGERVHLLTHHHQNACFRFYSREFRRIQDRFHMTISATFVGHTHNAEFHLFYDRPTANHAISVQWNAGSVAPWSRYNPNYNLYYVDRQIFQVNEMEIFMYNLEEANATPANRPRWFRLFSFAQFFGLQNLSPASIHTLVERLARTRSLLHQYWRFQVRESRPRVQAGCNDDCMRSRLCAMVMNEFGDNRRCDHVTALFNAN